MSEKKLNELSKQEVDYYFFQWLLSSKKMTMDKFDKLTQQEYFELEKEFMNSSDIIFE